VKAIQKIARDEIYIEHGLMKNLTLKKDTDYRAIVDNLSTREFNEFILLAKGLTKKYHVAKMNFSFGE